MDLTKLHLHWRASSYKGNTYRSYSLARPYRKDGKNRKEIVLKLGKLTDKKAARWRSFLKAIKKPDAFLATLDDIVVTKHFAYLDVAVANAVWDEWKLDDVFADNGRSKLGVATIARILATNRCIDTAAKSQTPEWFIGTALPWILDVDPGLVNSSRVFRELDVIEEHKEAICSHLFERMTEDYPDSMKSIFYDLSSTTFSGSRCVLMKWGHCKEGYRNHVVLALVVNRDGLPFYWEVLPGSTADATTICWLLERLERRFKISVSTLVFDRGMVSDENLALLEKAGIKYITAMDRSQLEGITGIDFNEFSNLEPDSIDEQAGELSGAAQDAIIPYREKVVIESSFRDIKSFVEIAPVHVWTEIHVKAHYTICVLSHLINRTLTMRLHENPGDLTRDIVSHERLYKKLSDCMIDCIEVENVRLSTYNMTRTTEYEKELLQRVGLDRLRSRNTVNKARTCGHP